MTPPFSPVEAARLSGCLDRLTPHLQLTSVAITGGVGIQLGLAASGSEGARTRVADLDLVAASLDAVRPSVVGRFLVSHYHVEGPGVPKFLIQLVDAVSRIRIDVFPDLLGSISRAHVIGIGDHSIQVLPLESIFEHKIQTLSRASRAAPIDPKHVDDARLLGAALSRPVPCVPAEAITPDVYGIEREQSCDRCALSRHPAWPLAPKDRIAGLLDWQCSDATEGIAR